MSAYELLRAGRLDDAFTELKDQIRRDAANPKLRVFLFQLFAVRGDWHRALTQLNSVAELDPQTMAMAQMYRTAMECEALRSEVFRGNRSPLILGEPEPWMAMLMQALGHLAAGEFEQARTLQMQAFELAPASAGTIDDQHFDWLADADSRLGPVLEAVVNGAYYWIPFHRIRQIDIEPPVDLRDVVWTVATFTWTNGGEMVGLIPTRYAGSELSADSAVLMSRKTDWNDLGNGYFVGSGQRMLTTDTGDFSLMDVRKVVFHPVSDVS
jgi:type VI secretion system protein ImpE